MEEATKPWMSKTLWAALLTAASPFFPPVQALVIANPEIASTLVGIVFGALRLLNGKSLPVVGMSGKPVSISSPGAAINLTKK